MPRVYDKDPYAILGIPTTATASQIKEAYRRLARKYHPDLNQDARAAEKMKDINWAKDILSDPGERSLYDFWRRANIRSDIPPRPNPPRSQTPPSSSGSASHNPPPRQPPPAYGNSTNNPPPRTTYAHPMQTPRAQGCSTGTIVVALLLFLMNLFRSTGSSSRPIYVVNSATQTAQYENLLFVLGTFSVNNDLTPPVGTPTPRPLYLTLSPVSPTPTVLRDEFGHEDLRPKIHPDSQEWKWINQYFPQLTTKDGLSDEVTFVFWDQTQRAIVIRTRQSGVFIISTYGGQITAGHYGENPPTTTPDVNATPSP